MTLPVPRLERMLVAIAAQLETIQVANDFNTDAGLLVLRQRSGVGDDELPCINLQYLGETTTDGGSNILQQQYLIGIEIHVAADQDNTGTQMVLAMSDVKACLGAWTYSEGVRDAGGQLAGLTFTGAEPVERVDGAAITGMRVNATLVSPEARGDPTRKAKFDPT